MVIQQLSGKALGCTAAIRRRGGATTTDFDVFLKEFKTVFDHFDQGQSSSQRLLQLRQGSGLASDYAISFHILVAGSGWNDAALIPVFCHGLTAELQLELACQDVRLDLDGMIAQAISLDQHLRGKDCCTTAALKPEHAHDREIKKVGHQVFHRNCQEPMILNQCSLARHASQSRKERGEWIKACAFTAAAQGTSSQPAPPACRNLM